MRFPRISAAKNSGLTLPEVMVVVAIIVIIFGIGLPVSWNFYLDYQFDSEYETLFNILQQARNFSMTNINQAAHGVYLNTQKFIVFQGASFSGRTTSLDLTYPRSGAITISGASELVFTQLDGSTASTTFTVSDSRKSRELYVNSEGLVYTP